MITIIIRTNLNQITDMWNKNFYAFYFFTLSNGDRLRAQKNASFKGCVSFIFGT